MKKSMKIAIITAAALVVLGIVVAGLGFWGMGFNLRALNTEDIISTTFEITDTFHDISIETDVADLHFVVSEDGVCRVECVDFANETYTVNMENGTLTIAKNNNRTWHESVSLASIGETCVTVYLPEENYTSLRIDVDTGDIEMPSAFSFEQAVLNTSTGDICWLAPVSEELSITTDTGDVEVRSTSPRSLALKTNTGDITLQNVSAGELLAIESDTGDVAFDRSDAAEIFVRTNTGDVTGTLVSDKVFLIETNTGDVDVPKSVMGGKCEIHTNTGDIDISMG